VLQTIFFGVNAPMQIRTVQNRCTAQHDATVGPCAHCAIRSLAVCSVLKDEELDAFEAIITPVKREPGQAIFLEGDPAEHVFNVTEGVLKTFKLLPDGRRQITGFVFEADFLGLALGEGDAFPHTAEALTSVHLCQMRRRDFEGMLERFPKMEQRLLSMARDELAVAQEQMLLLGRKHADERVASFLVSLAERAIRLGIKGDMLSLPMTRTDIADFLGLTLETVSRTMSRLKREKCISPKGRQDLRILNLERLRDIGTAA